MYQSLQLNVMLENPDVRLVELAQAASIVLSTCEDGHALDVFFHSVVLSTIEDGDHGLDCVDAFLRSIVLSICEDGGEGLCLDVSLLSAGEARFSPLGRSSSSSSYVSRVDALIYGTPGDATGISILGKYGAVTIVPAIEILEVGGEGRRSSRNESESNESGSVHFEGEI